MKYLYSAIAFAGSLLFSTQGLAHHEGATHGVPISGLAAAVATGVTLIAIASLVGLLCKPAR